MVREDLSRGNRNDRIGEEFEDRVRRVIMVGWSEVEGSQEVRGSVENIEFRKSGVEFEDEAGSVDKS